MICFCFLANKEIAGYLIEKGADIDSKDKNEWTPLHHNIIITGKPFCIFCYIRSLHQNVKNVPVSPIIFQIAQIWSNFLLVKEPI